MAIMGGMAAVGGGVAAAFTAQPHFTEDIYPPLNYVGSQLTAQCSTMARSRHYVDREGFDRTLQSMKDYPYGQSGREGALFCRAGTWLEILDRHEAKIEAHKRGHKHPQYIRAVLQFISMAFGLVSIRGVESGRFLCMDRHGRLYGSPHVFMPNNQYNAECVFMETMLENYYNMYASCAYGWHKRPWYVALNRAGIPKNGRRMRKRKKAAHWLVVHFDDSPFGARHKALHKERQQERHNAIKLSRQEHTKGYAKGANWYEHFLGPRPNTDDSQIKTPSGVSLDDVLMNTLNQRRSPRTTYNLFESDRQFVDRRRMNARRREELYRGPEMRRRKRKRRKKERLERENERRERRRQELSTSTTRAHRVLL
ncbi:hypothetical protein QR680_013663 [Steinernema hermaphroditum]|uniref:Uncharacterized protein n=1 Tax=Steinernema hermaphroditum TaxID=289476 RepID=A0AA39I686_9BILA|nr:hypothetical protein QR680_013663 [Steinernema hermaphroditum]